MTVAASTDSAPISTAAGLPAGLALGAVRLRVRDAARAIAFYTGTLGLNLLAEESDGIVRLGAGGHVLVELEERRDARPRPRGTTGLFHVAILVPDRPALAVVLRRLVAQRVAIGASDHIVSEALYLDDPDGNGIEIYRDRPASEWRWENGTVAMATDQLDGRGLLNEAPAATPLDEPLPAGTRVGHVHLQVGDLAGARRFYVDHLGFDVTTDRYPGALFVSAGGYHHHLGLNVWQSRGGGPAPQDSVGLVHYAIKLPDAAAVEALRIRLEVAGESTAPIPGGFSAADPWGTRVRVSAA
ncbi:catechol 2,3-dioxygenase [Angulomicrobium tetraedrale]|uniref:Catechol 2,3-dioxygenase n=1 Tax=Ancylobacter tetraedralis TaxID=217068 RepID=A0A839ZCE5_9HYPH|nr:VOC family protein [Ancylobacter tetraedralis]MBB3772352.1 catechol 2,3-dioxygenase [Ancylobacter tetraedralis]